MNDVKTTLVCLNQVLIETYWNVNFVSALILKGTTLRLNRNILECKCLFRVCPKRLPIRLNRNILECKLETAGEVLTLALSLNRNILECKYMRI